MNGSVVAVVLAALVMVGPSPCLGGTMTVDNETKQMPRLRLSLIYETEHSLKLAFDYLLGSQEANGSWKHDPAITAMVLYGFLKQPSYRPSERTDMALEKGLTYLETFVKPDGGIYREQLKNYTTSVCLLAFVATEESQYRTIIRDAKEFLIRFQLDENEDVGSNHPFYGGIGYGGDDRPDLSNTQFALEAIRAAEIYERSGLGAAGQHSTLADLAQVPLGAHWRKALIFLGRTQNVKSINDMPYAMDDGGFIYETGHYKDERSHSYGSMTYAGLKSLLFAQVDRDDVRVRRAVEWIGRHYTVEENPGFGTTSLYYYYMTAAKCLNELGQEIIRDDDGTDHYWRKELIEKLLSLQHEDGYWVNADGRYWENIKDLATAYAVTAIKFALPESGHD